MRLNFLILTCALTLTTCMARRISVEPPITIHEHYRAIEKPKDHFIILVLDGTRGMEEAMHDLCATRTYICLTPATPIGGVYTIDRRRK